MLLLDAWGPGHARASSGGESRMTRGAYGSDEVYTAFALESLADWRALSDRAQLPLFHRTGVLFFFGSVEPYLEQTMAVHRRLGLPTELLDNRAMRERFPQIDFAGVEAGGWEPDFGVLMARRAARSRGSPGFARRKESAGRWTSCCRCCCRAGWWSAYSC